MLRLAFLAAIVPLFLCSGNYTNVVVSADGSVVVEENASQSQALPMGTPVTIYGGFFDNFVTLGGTADVLQIDSPSFAKSMEMRNSATMFAQWLNSERGGLRVGGKRLGMWLLWADDGDSVAQVANATSWSLRGQVLPANFALGGYGSDLVRYAAMQARADGKLMMAAGANNRTIFNGGEGVFGLLPDGEAKTGDIFMSIRLRAQTVDANSSLSYPCGGNTGCVAQLRYGIYGACRSYVVPLAQKIFPATVTREAKAASVEDLRAALQRLKAAGVTILQTCSLTLVELKTVTQQMSDIDFNVFALIAESTVLLSGYKVQMNEGWWQGGYILDGVPWTDFDSGGIRGDFSGLTSKDFVSNFRSWFAYTPSYLASAQYAALCALSAAIEASNSTNSATVAAKLQTLRMQEFYGVIQFANNQINLTHMIIQASGTGLLEPSIVYPLERSSSMLVFPKPTWAQMQCRFDTQVLSSECAGHGTCDSKGVCLCVQGWSGITCNEFRADVEASMQLEQLWWSLEAIGGIIVFVSILAIAFSCFRRRRERWKEVHLRNFEAAIRTENVTLLRETHDHLRRLGWFPGRIAEYEQCMRRRLSEEAGVSVVHLLGSEFLELARVRSRKEDPTFYDLRDVFFFGEGAIGADIICPRDGRPGCSLLDALEWQYRGQCTHFMSWTWAYKISTLRSALGHWVETDSVDTKNCFIFMCFFVNNQYRIIVSGEMAGSEDLENVFERNLTRIGKVIALLDTWDEPVYLTRVWTIFEQVVAIKLDIPVRMILPEAANVEFLSEIEKGKSGLLRVKDALTKVDSKSAKASCPKDEAAVKQLIERTVGFTDVDDHIIDFMIKWVGSEVETHMKDLVKE